MVKHCLHVCPQYDDPVPLARGQARAAPSWSAAGLRLLELSLDNYLVYLKTSKKYCWLGNSPDISTTSHIVIHICLRHIVPCAK